MNHRQYEEWLLSEEPLERDDDKALRLHLSSCKACAELAHGWQEARAFLRHAEIPAPDAGFTQRWEQRLADEEYRRKSWQGWLVLALVTVVGITLLLRPGGTRLLSIGDLLGWFSEASTRILALFGGLETVVETFFNFFPQTTPVMWLMVINLGAVVILTIWLIAMKQLVFVKEYQK